MFSCILVHFWGGDRYCCSDRVGGEQISVMRLQWYCKYEAIMCLCVCVCVCVCVFTLYSTCSSLEPRKVKFKRIFLAQFFPVSIPFTNCRSLWEVHRKFPTKYLLVHLKVSSTVTHSSSVNVFHCSHYPTYGYDRLPFLFLILDLFAYSLSLCGCTYIPSNFSSFHSVLNFVLEVAIV